MKVEVETVLQVKKNQGSKSHKFLEQYGLKSEEARAKFDEQMLLLATLCNSPMAFVSILHEEYYYILGDEGFGSDGMPSSQTLSKYTVNAGKTLVIEDTLKHRSFEDNPMVNNSKPIRFYAGVPLLSNDGTTSAVVCVMDYKAKKLSSKQVSCLELIARKVQEDIDYQKLSSTCFAELESNFDREGSLNIAQRQDLLVHKISELSSKNKEVQKQDASLKFANMLLQEKQKDLAHLVDASPSCIAVIDADFKYIFVNSTYEHWMGFKKTELVGEHISKVLGEEKFPLVKPLLENVFLGNGEILDFQHETTEGSKTLRVHMRPVNQASRNNAAAYIFAEDISEIKEVQTRLENTNDDLKFFSSRASHDLKAPLGIIESFSDVLKNDFADQLDETGLQYLSFIQESASQMKRLVTDLFAFARAGRADGKVPEMIELQEVIAIVKKNIHLLIEESGADIVVNEALPQVRVRQSDAVQLFQNLIANSIKYRKPDTAPAIDISYQISAEQIGIQITDNGIGIEKENLDKVFDPFFRSYHPNISGSGIGLATCQKVVDHYQGKIWITSKFGEGSTFHFTLPRA